jgi:peptidoglycan/LPS O-acetylase OafA/YrhL
MGSIRTILAIAVVFAHSYGFVFVGGRLAVQLFYIISGFLISYILIESRTYQTKTAFYKNRFLRLFPIYWIVAIVTFLAIFTVQFSLNQTHNIISTFDAVSWQGKASLAFSNIFIFGQDWIMFTGVRDGVFQFVTNFNISEVAVWQGLLVPQAWTLGVEISFYVIAPFVLVKPRLMLFLLLSSLLLRGYLISIGLGMKDPWTYRFFPTELALFLLGACSHQFLKPWYEVKGLITSRLSVLFTLVIFIYCVIYFLLPYRTLNTLLLLAVFIFSLPYLFHFQSLNRWDKKIGELSYPIYISHFLVIWTFGYLLEKFGINYRSLAGSFLIVMVTIALSHIINISIGRFVEQRRTAVKSNQLGIK